MANLTKSGSVHHSSTFSDIKRPRDSAGHQPPRKMAYIKVCIFSSLLFLAASVASLPAASQDNAASPAGPGDKHILAGSPPHLLLEVAWGT